MRQVWAFLRHFQAQHLRNTPSPYSLFSTTVGNKDKDRTEIRKERRVTYAIWYILFFDPRVSRLHLLFLFRLLLQHSYLIAYQRRCFKVEAVGGVVHLAAFFFDELFCVGSSARIHARQFRDSTRA